MHSLNRLLKLRNYVRFMTTSIDPTQEASLKETCFLVDTTDKVIGKASKKECHAVINNKCPPLHRAFSVFLFNKKGDLLLQKRSDEKVFETLISQNYISKRCFNDR